MSIYVSEGALSLPPSLSTACRAVQCFDNLSKATTETEEAWQRLRHFATR